MCTHIIHKNLFLLIILICKILTFVCYNLLMDIDEKKIIKVDISVKSITRVLLFAVGVYLFFQLTSVILIVLTSIVIASFVEHIVKRLEKHKIPRPVTVVTIYLIGIGTIVVISTFLLPILVKEVSSLVDFIGKLFQKSSLFNAFPFETLSDTKDFFSQISGDVSSTELIRSTQVFLGKVSSGVGGSIGTVFGSIINTVMVGVISFYLSIQEKGVEDFLRIVTPIKYEHYVITERKIALWVQGQLLLGLIIAVILFIGLTLLKVKYALLLAIIAGFSELIPYGLLLAFIPAIAVAFTEGSLKLAGSTLILYTVVQQFENYVIVPIVVKKSTGISQLVVILALFIGATLAGFWGILLAVPVSVLLIEYLTDLEEKKFQYLQKQHLSE
jgi:predicted PurR-regulated permease PerM